VASKRKDEAQAKFFEAAAIFESQGFEDKAIAIYSVTAGHFPDDVSVHFRHADALVRRGRKPDAVKNLLAARVSFASSKRVQERRAILEKVCELHPYQFNASFELAKLLFQTKHRDEAKALLEELAKRTSGRLLRKVRARHLALFPGPRPLYRWLRAALLGR
jgi:thioredoxin-like negative regulator of GroEL